MIIESVIFGIIAAGGWGISDLLTAAISRKLGILRTVVNVHLVAAIICSFYIIVLDGFPEITLAHWVDLTLLSGLGFVTYIFFYKALQSEQVGLISPIVASYSVVVIVLSVVFLGERLNVVQVIGASGTVIGVILLSCGSDSTVHRKFTISSGVIFGVVAMIGIGVWQYFIALLSRDLGWFIPVYVNRVIMLFMFAFTSGLTKTVPWRKFSLSLWMGVILIAVAETAGLFAFSRGAEIGTISLVAASSTTYPIIPIMGGILLFNERMGARQIFGVILTIVGLTVLLSVY